MRRRVRNLVIHRGNCHGIQIVSRALETETYLSVFAYRVTACYVQLRTILYWSWVILRDWSVSRPAHVRNVDRRRIFVGSVLVRNVQRVRNESKGTNRKRKEGQNKEQKDALDVLTNLFRQSRQGNLVTSNFALFSLFSPTLNKVSKQQAMSSKTCK